MTTVLVAHLLLAKGQCRVGTNATTSRETTWPKSAMATPSGATASVSNVKYRVPWLDGAYVWEPGRGPPMFREHAGVSDADVGLLVQPIRFRVLQALRKVASGWTSRTQRMVAAMAGPL